jgi:hypothetical protein
MEDGSIWRYSGNRTLGRSRDYFPDSKVMQRRSLAVSSPPRPIDNQLSIISSVTTLNPISALGPNVVLRATSIASRPLAINIRPIRGTLLRGSKLTTGLRGTPRTKRRSPSDYREVVPRYRSNTQCSSAPECSYTYRMLLRDERNLGRRLFARYMHPRRSWWSEHVHNQMFIWLWTKSQIAWTLAQPKGVCPNRFQATGDSCSISQ